MKNLLYFLLLVGVVSGCKKEQPTTDICDGIVCLNGSICVNGTCVCDSFFTGANCETEIIPIDSFVGNYHMVGYTYSWYAGTDTTIWIDEVRTVTKINDSTLAMNSESLRFTKQFADDSVNYYNYMWVYGPHSYSRLSFHRPLDDDSVFYYGSGGGLGGGGYTTLSGVKIQ